MLGEIITMISAVTLTATFHGASLPPPVANFSVPDQLVVSVTSGDDSRTVSNGLIDKFPFTEKYFLNDGNLPFSITMSSVNNPMIPGTRVPVYKIAALLEGGSTVDGVMKDYPSLEREQIETAGVYAKANPYSGRPYATKSLASALLEMDFNEYLVG
jgi:uncharacterized protein (DUF433 family)